MTVTNWDHGKVKIPKTPITDCTRVFIVDNHWSTFFCQFAFCKTTRINMLKQFIIVAFLISLAVCEIYFQDKNFDGLFLRGEEI